MPVCSQCSSVQALDSLSGTEQVAFVVDPPKSLLDVSRKLKSQRKQLLPRKLQSLGFRSSIRALPLGQAICLPIVEAEELIVSSSLLSMSTNIFFYCSVTVAGFSCTGDLLMPPSPSRWWATQTAAAQWSNVTPSLPVRMHLRSSPWRRWRLWISLLRSSRRSEAVIGQGEGLGGDVVRVKAIKKASARAGPRHFWGGIVTGTLIWRRLFIRNLTCTRYKLLTESYSLILLVLS